MRPPSEQAVDHPSHAAGRVWLAALGLALLVFGVFHSARNGEFLAWDDDINLTTNPHLHPLTGENLRWMLTDTDWMRRYVPLAWLGWAAEQAIFGLSAPASHAINLGFHAANACLTFAILCLLLRLKSGANRGTPAAVVGWSFMLALFWALHPLRVEPVAWASGRLYLQATFWVLLAVWAYLHSQTTAQATATRWRVAAVGLYAASLATYPIALGLPAALLLIDAAVTGRLSWHPARWTSDECRQVWREKIPFLAVAGMALGMTLWSRATVSGVWLGNTAGTIDAAVLIHRLMRALHHSLQILWKPFVPLGLGPVYIDLIDPNPWALPYLASAVVLLSVTLALLRAARHNPAPLAIWSCHFVFVLPYLGLTEATHYPNDRYTYLHGIIFLAVAAPLTLKLSLRAWSPFIGVGLVTLGLLAHRQVPIWRNDETLFRHALSNVGEHFYRGDLTWRLGNALRQDGRKEEALRLYEETLRIALGADSKAAAHHGLAVLALESGDAPRALEHWRAAATLAPTTALYHQWTAFLLLQAGRVQEAAVAIERGRRYDPANPELIKYERGVRQLLGEGRDTKR
jgi:hypothetical protein